MLYLFGRKAQADVELLGDDEAVAALSDKLPRASDR